MLVAYTREIKGDSVSAQAVAIERYVKSVGGEVSLWFSDVKGRLGSGKTG